MEEISVSKKQGTSTGKKSRSRVNRQDKPSISSNSAQIPEKFSQEVDENFMNYLSWHGLANEDNTLVLSSRLHYYYDYEELKEITTLINLKKLNLVKHLDDFLHTLYNGLSPKTNFVGCFTDRKVQKGKGISSRLYKKFLNFIDAKIDTEIDGQEFSKMLESHGFKVIDMTEIDGLTYFRTQNFRMATV